jgi:hypothetical protein
MNTATIGNSQEITTFEEYTIYSLQQSVSGVLSIMERSKQIANFWPDLHAMVAAAEMCRELAALCTYMDSLAETLGEVAGEQGAAWDSARGGLQLVMRQMSDDVLLADEGGAQVLFGTTLPAALHAFHLVIPALQEHVREKYQGQDITVLERNS